MEILRRRGYEGIKRIDSGGQANVYRTKKRGKYYAIKISKVNAEDNSTRLNEELKLELVIISRVEHPNCIKVHELFRTSTQIFIVMDFMPNGTLGEKVRQQGKATGKGLNEWPIRLWFPPIVRAVKYLHHINVAHRDLKLDNILLDNNINPMVSDYGYSIFIKRDKDGNVIETNDYCGTPSHMPPEMLMRQAHDPLLADVWCLGVMLFIMANYKYPFDKNMEEKDRFKLMMGRRYSLQQKVIEESSPLLQNLIGKLLEPVPKKRLTCRQICEHSWFPCIYGETDLLLTKTQK